MTDDELRELLKKKCSTLAAAFRKFDKNGDGVVNKGEFLTGLRGIGVDMPPKIMNRMWQMADEDGSGELRYQEFARKFANYKHTASMHRHVQLKSEADAKAEALHGVGAGSRMAKTSQHRKSVDVAFTLDDHLHDADATEEKHQTTQQLARSEHLRTVKVEDA